MRGTNTRAQCSLFRPSFFEVAFRPPKFPQNTPQNHPKIAHFCLIFGSWAAPGASQSDFGRSQSAQGALGELFEIIQSLQNPHFDALGRSWGPLGALLDPQEHPKSSKWPQNYPKCSQNAPQIDAKFIQICQKNDPKYSKNAP